MTPEQVDYYNAHGTSTSLNDRVETQVLKDVFGGRPGGCRSARSRGRLGHSLGAASAIEAAVSVRALREQMIPPTINFLPDPELDLDYVPNQAQAGPARCRHDRGVRIRRHQQRPGPQEDDAMTATAQHSSLIAEVTRIVRESAKIPPWVPIDASSRLVEDLAIDSLDLVNLILALQDHFDVAIEEEAVPNLCRIADLAAYLSERRESNRS